MFHVIANAKSIVQPAIYVKNGIMKHASVSVKINVNAKNYSQNPSSRICKNGKCLKSIVDDSKTVYDEIIYVMDIASTNITSTVSINSDDKKVRYKIDCYILHTTLLVIILLLIIAIICYHHTKHRSKQKDISALTI